MQIWCLEFICDLGQSLIDDPECTIIIISDQCIQTLRPYFADATVNCL
jgi:hypothetical protein